MTTNVKGTPIVKGLGFDSFGLPAENAAIKTGRHPRGFTDERIEELRRRRDKLRRRRDDLRKKRRLER